MCGVCLDVKLNGSASYNGMLVKDAQLVLLVERLMVRC